MLFSFPHALLWRRQQQLVGTDSAPCSGSSPWAILEGFPFSLLSIVKGIKSCCISITVSSSNSSSSGRSRTELFVFVFFFTRQDEMGRKICNMRRWSRNQEENKTFQSSAMQLQYLSPGSWEDRCSSGDHIQSLWTGKSRWASGWGRNHESHFQGLCQRGGTKG